MTMTVVRHSGSFLTVHPSALFQPSGTAARGSGGRGEPLLEVGQRLSFSIAQLVRTPSRWAAVSDGNAARRREGLVRWGIVATGQAAWLMQWWLMEPAR